MDNHSDGRRRFLVRAAGLAGVIALGSANGPASVSAAPATARLAAGATPALASVPAQVRQAPAATFALTGVSYSALSARPVPRRVRYQLEAGG